MTDRIATVEGYTQEAVADRGDHTLYLLVKPNTLLDGVFTAWDTDNQEFIRVNGWLYSITIGIRTHQITASTRYRIRTVNNRREVYQYRIVRNAEQWQLENPGYTVEWVSEPFEQTV